MCPWSFTSLTSFNCFFKPSRISWSNFYQLQVLQITTSFNCFFKPIRISSSNFYQLHVLILILLTHDIMIFGGMNGKNSGNESRAEGENDEMSAPNYHYHDWIICYLSILWHFLSFCSSFERWLFWTIVNDRFYDHFTEAENIPKHLIRHATGAFLF